MRYYIKVIFTASICIFEVYMFLDFMGLYAKYKQNSIRRIFSVFGLAAAILILNLFENSILNLCCIPILYLIGSGLLFEIKIKSRIFYITFFYVILAGSEIIGEILTGLVNRSKDVTSYNSFKVIGIILIAKILTFILLKLISRVRKIQEKYYKYKLFWLFLILPFSSFMMYGSIFYYDLEGEGFSLKKIIIITACIALLFSNAIVFYVFEALSEAMYRTREMELINMKNRMEYDHYKQLEIINSEHNKYMHDMKHFIEAVCELIDTGDFTEAEDVLQKINIKSKEIENMRYCTNSILNAVLCEKRGTAVSKDIVYQVFIEKGIVLAHMDSLDIIVVFGNLIDNAIEAASGWGNKGYVKIELFLTAAGNFIMLKVKNNYVEKPVFKNSRLITAKKDKKHHGIGLKSVEESIIKYGGMLDYHLNDEEFEVDIMLSVTMVECMDNR